MLKKSVLLLLTLFIFFGCTPEKEKWIFILAGQSNMAGRGIVEPQDTISDASIFTLDKEMNLVAAKEPLHFYEPNLTGLDCGLSFAKELRSQIPANIEIVLIPCAVGGSSIDQWLNDSAHRNVKLYSNFKDRVTVVKSMGTIKGILWHQGESDAHPNKLPNYQNKLEQLFQNFRTDVGDESLLILAGELGEYAEPEERNNNWKALNHTLHKVAKNDENLSIVSSKGLKSNPDMVHFNSEAQRELGKRFAKEFLNVSNP
jgi:hypothetical protein